MLATVAAADSASTVRKNDSVFIYNEAEPHALYAIYKQTLTWCVLPQACGSTVIKKMCYFKCFSLPFKMRKIEYIIY